MVQLKHSLLALALACQLVWAIPKDSTGPGSIIEQRGGGFNDQYVFATCPNPPNKCSTCGGDSKKKGFCDNERGRGWWSDYNRCKQWHKEGCGLTCECVSEETGKPGSGLPLIIPFPPSPVGFIAPPAAVPNPKKVCNEDYTKNSCKDCKPLDGWCTVGDQAGCPCREECPADDKKPDCSADDCKGEKGSCTVGHYKDCKCKAECPKPEKEVLVCSDDTCKGKDNKCTTGTNEGCECYELTSEIYTLGTKSEVESFEKVLTKLVDSMKKQDEEAEKPKDPEVKCSSTDYSKAVSVDVSFMSKLADKFCSGDTSKKRSQDLTAKDVSSSAYKNYKFHFELDPGKNCKTDCKAAFKSMAGKCQGYDSHSIQPEASAKVDDCSASFSYKITVPDKPKPKPDTFTQHGLQERKCHTADQFGSHGDVRGSEISMAATGCAGISDDKAKLKAGSDPIELKSTYGSTKFKFTMSWIENCEGDEQDARYPFGGAHNLGNTCWQLLLDDWQKCNNGGAGGSIDYSCVRYDFRPSFD
ncbi:hypothetical protein N7499_005045 [Penicillium canescens]|uniref:Uncharacterized protein n=1 Tax=Penicillium canescens TaxID=5083 RepID=A0AAD6I171_PENCN|nr:uncharacterized protein N7446_004457 [Penicillium canescens]KAJ6026941.1 hypothetical protein N7460_011758 [Penicillium canescens]KAJ6040225.1 hypothetical protein N7444_009130 [Penicillium canescens]KAJ6067420.1 hypothetical protein N7446_004457 [Penicillium canescens]KAJ6085416.1 hypothetical protein N7499_005045 [Penicillium canescens]KAJ6162195.1 hypothetical protein N7485_010425 [Penicillium canescens]